MIAHHYSSSKLPFLDLAKENFSSSLQILPQPYAGLASDLCYAMSSPLYQKSGSNYDSPFKTVHKRSLSMIETPLKFRKHENLDSTDEHGNIASPSNYDRSDRDGDIENDTDGDGYNRILPLTPVRSDHHKRRLTQSLSYNHVMAEDLVPSPLFSRNQINRIAGHFDAKVPPAHTLFNHPLREEQYSLPCLSYPPQKRTVHTLIQQFETQQPITDTPVTCRFDQIHHAFSPLPENQHLQSYLTSVSVERYNFYLASFRTHLLSHRTAVERRIQEAMALQTERKARKGNRIASFWTFQPIAQDNSLDYTKIARRERIEKLRKIDWQVRKERHGWKGEAYYEALRRQAEAELH